MAQRLGPCYCRGNLNETLILGFSLAQLWQLWLPGVNQLMEEPHLSHSLYNSDLQNKYIYLNFKNMQKNTNIAMCHGV